MGTTTCMAGVLMAAALISAGHPSVAQDKGKTAAAELAAASQAALEKLSGSVQLAKLLTPKAQAILVFPKVTKAGLGVGGQYG
jgi:lipid-binding SYLF domain-containing protein